LNKYTRTKPTEGNISLQKYVAHLKKLSQNWEDDSNRVFDKKSIFSNTTNEFINNAFIENEILITMKKLKNNKSCGYDNIVNEFFLNCPLNAVSLIGKVFNIVLESGLVPTQWCGGVIKPI
jgi:hypothetical protein